MDSVLVLNAGSSTLKFALFEGSNGTLRGTVEIGNVSAIDSVIQKLEVRTPRAVGHRVVHGGETFTAPVRIEPDTLSKLDSLAPLAPLHIPAALDGIRAVAKAWPDEPQVACFDTAFHATMPSLERRFGLPRRFHDRGIRRYGFHGLSYESIAGQLPRVSPRAATGRTVVCHLGNGASLCGMLAGKGQTTTMGFTPLDGLLMATRPGRLDPGVVLHLLKTGMSVDAVEHLLEHESGLLGVSGIGSDMRTLLASPAPEAAEAVQLFCRTVAKEVAAAATVLGGLDALVFTAGIGERAAPVRELICERLTWLGAFIDPTKNARHDERLHADSSAVEIYRLATDEETVIAAHTAAILGTTP